MIERGNDTAFDWRVYAGGEIPVQWYFRKDGDLPVAVQAWTIPPGASEGSHSHREDRPLEELYIVVAGEAEVTLDGEVSRLGVGDAFLAKTGVDHDVANPGAVPLTMIVVWGPPGAAIWQDYSMGRRPDEQGRAGSPVW
ncbi:cupin domain-containing protein [Nocardioides sp. GXZ039]|uniref:cupin domain-containing protein n=1 Tax=Nocardioides sp. GXZ039 TaxID=3136018 RepID=UPI0030F3A80F